MAEWSNAVDSKSIVLFNGVPRVRIPISPPVYLKGRFITASFFVSGGIAGFAGG